MKRILTLLILALIIASHAACGSDTPTATPLPSSYNMGPYANRSCGSSADPYRHSRANAGAERDSARRPFLGNRVGGISARVFADIHAGINGAERMEQMG